MVEVADSLEIEGSLEEVYRCFWDPEIWPKVTTHVTRIEMLESTDREQRFLMFVASDGEVHEIETRREGQPLARITYRQTRPPVFLRRHSGEWRFVPVDGRVRVELVHRAELDPEIACKKFGGVSLDEARQRVSTALSNNGRRTMVAIKELIEGGGSIGARRPGPPGETGPEAVP